MGFRHWILAGALVTSGAALAQGTEEQPQGGGEFGGAGTEGEQQHPPTGGQEHQQMQQQAQAQLNQIYSEKGKKEAFEIKGKVAGFDQQTGAIVLQRENLPNAMLLLTQKTDVKVDGKTASAQQLQPGSEVRASFNLAQGMPVAVSIDAKKPKGMKEQKGGAGMGGTQEPKGGGMGY